MVERAVKSEPLHRLEQLLTHWGRERLRLNEIGWRKPPNVLYSLSSEMAEAKRKDKHHDGVMFANLIRGTGDKLEPEYQPSEDFRRVEYEVNRMPLERARLVLYIEYDPRCASKPLKVRASHAELNRHTYRIALDQGHAYLLGRITP